MNSIFKGIGEYPPEYNREVHGPYNPSMYYGKRDTPFGEVKLRDLPSWLLRRNKSPRAICQAISRAWYRYQYTWVQTKVPNASYVYHIVFFVSFTMWIMDYDKYKKERLYRYH